MDRLAQGIFGLTAAQLILGTLGVSLIESGIDSVSAVYYRSVIGGLVLLAYCAWQHDLISLRQLPKREIILTTLSAVLMIANWVLFFEGIRLTSIAVATIVFHVQPFFVVLLGAVLLRERVPAIIFAWIGLALIGLVFATGISAGELAAASDYTLGLLVTISAALSYALVTIIAKGLVHTKPHQLTLIQCIVGALALGFIAPGDASSYAYDQWGWLLVMGIVHTGGVYILLYGSLPKLTTPLIAVLLFVYPASAVVVDAFFYDHHINLLQVAGLATIILASLGVTLKWGQRTVV